MITRVAVDIDIVSLAVIAQMLFDRGADVESMRLSSLVPWSVAMLAQEAVESGEIEKVPQNELEAVTRLRELGVITDKRRVAMRKCHMKRLMEQSRMKHPKREKKYG